MKRRNFLKILGGIGIIAVCSPKSLPKIISLNDRVIYVDKSRSIMELYQNTKDSWELEKRYNIRTGRNSGDKQKEGDAKTPEGTYRIIEKMFDRNYKSPGHPKLTKLNDQLNDIYGPIAMSINYPNAQDKRIGKTGHGIWIHGGEFNDTNGCIKMYNSDIKDLEKRIDVGTKIIIKQRIQYANTT